MTKLLLTMLLLLSLGASAQWTPTANLTVFSEDGAKFFLVLNGERYNDVAQTNIRIEELPNPYYNCKVIFENKALPDISKSALMLADADGVMQDVTYRIKKDNKGRNVLRFFSFAPAQQNMQRPANCATYRFGAPNMLIGAAPIHAGTSTTTTIQQTTMSPASNVNVRVGGVGINMNIADPMMGSTTTTTTTTTTTNSNGVPDNDFSNVRNPQRRSHNNNNRGGCNRAMSNADFDDAKRTIANSSFDATRLSTAKQIAANNCLSTGQIGALLPLFSFESSKLDFAKYAYDYCLDANNYYKVANGFTFESSKTELSNYVQGIR